MTTHGSHERATSIGLMGAGHSHQHAGAHAGARHRWRLAVAFGLVAGFLGVELAAGFWSGSLALLSDAGHMAADVVALGAALVATRIAVRPDHTGRRTYGSYRAEVLASGLTVLLMLGAAAYVIVEAVRRHGSEAGPASAPMIVVGALGLLVNLVALALLRGGASESINVKGAYLEVLADTLGSVGVVVAGVLVATTGSTVWDTAIAVVIAVFIAVRALVLAREVLAVLSQHAPAGMSPDVVAGHLEAVPGVSNVHDLHLWTLTSGMHVATAHVVTEPGADRDRVLTAARAVLADEHGIDHATVQVETDPAACEELSW